MQYIFIKKKENFQLLTTVSLLLQAAVFTAAAAAPAACIHWYSRGTNWTDVPQSVVWNIDSRFCWFVSNAVISSVSQWRVDNRCTVVTLFTAAVTGNVVVTWIGWTRVSSIRRLVFIRLFRISSWRSQRLPAYWASIVLQCINVRMFNHWQCTTWIYAVLEIKRNLETQRFYTVLSATVNMHISNWRKFKMWHSSYDNAQFRLTAFSR